LFQIREKYGTNEADDQGRSMIVFEVTVLRQALALPLP
jgi:hypothetical protein